MKPNVSSQIKGIVDNPDQNQQMEMDEDTLPNFLQKDNIMDINMHRPSDSDYDPSTIHIPQEEFEKMTGTIK
jgi:hypothetical protein